MWRLPAAALSAVLISTAAGSALAEGFAIRDLRTVDSNAKAALGAGYLSRPLTNRLILTCTTCQGAPMIDITIGRQTDGTEARVRSGQTTIPQLQAQCQARSPSCRIGAVSLPPAVGWVSSYTMGAMAGSTAVIIRDGDMLTLRVITDDPALSRRLAETLISTVGRQIVGR